MNPYSVIKKPMLSEKSVDLRENESKYTFIVQLKATKNDIKKAIKSLYDVDVQTVKTSITRGKLKRRGKSYIMTKKKKKAVVTLNKGQKLDIFES